MNPKCVGASVILYEDDELFKDRNYIDFAVLSCSRDRAAPAFG
ncbi:MAG: hypothetical protein QNJ55_20060 [Xenococcus sp. MO_188.B8]|nr:hypothetical protein [Xenococcus sp. MO_188.B8]